MFFVDIRILHYSKWVIEKRSCIAERRRDVWAGKSGIREFCIWYLRDW